MGVGVVVDGSLGAHEGLGGGDDLHILRLITNLLGLTSVDDLVGIKVCIGVHQEHVTNRIGPVGRTVLQLHRGGSGGIIDGQGQSSLGGQVAVGVIAGSLHVGDLS